MKKILLLCIIASIAFTGCSAAEKNEQSDDSNISTSESTTAETTTATTETAISTTTTVSEIPVTEPVTLSIPETDISDGKLVRILNYIPDAVIDLRYATDNNFTNTVLYDSDEAYLCYGTVKKLMKVQDELKEKGYRILIWDAYRPPEAQQKLWEVCPNSTFVANPANGLTSHSKGGTIDISIVFEDGSEVEMPSAFDEFTSAADREYSDVSAEAAQNSMMLEEIMSKNGFRGYAGEWWDYTDNDVSQYSFEMFDSDTFEIYEIELSDNGDEFLSDFLSSNDYTYSDISDSKQLILIDSNGMNCNAYCYEKIENNWTQVHNSTGIVGKNGTTTKKHEGDFCTPKGLYSLGFGFGTESIDTNIEYRLINNNCYWVDDPNSVYYNKWVESENIDWQSAEHLIEYPQSYHYGVVIEYNTNPIISSAGSAIFLHCASGSYTAGCVAVPEDDMYFIMNWLNGKSEPIIIIK